MKIFVFGSSITSSYWNGAATYYRGIYKQLHALGHQITFAEPDAYRRLAAEHVRTSISAAQRERLRVLPIMPAKLSP